jgi:AraC family transcriptional regulator
MIYREMPAIWDPPFRQQFYSRWGRESAVISASTRRAEYPEFEQLLSVKMMSGGSEDYFVGAQRIAVDDDTFLILNAGRRYGSRIDAMRPAHSFSVFFAPGLAESVRDAMLRDTDALLADPQGDRKPSVEFGERLREHDGSVTPVLRYIRHVVDAGAGEMAWVDEQLQFLLARMLRLEFSKSPAHDRVQSAKPATRRELYRRVGLGTTFIHSHYRESIGLTEMARASHLSPFHFLRTFKAVHGVTPSAYLNGKRTGAAVRLIRESRWTMTEIALDVGFGNRTTLFRHLKKCRELRPNELNDRLPGSPRSRAGGDLDQDAHRARDDSGRAGGGFTRNS